MTTEVLTQLRALRESIAETLRKDPRYLTLAALDKTIVEISGVLTAAGVVSPPPPPAAPMHFEASSQQSAAVPEAAPAAAAPSALEPSSAAAPAQAAASRPAAATESPTSGDHPKTQSLLTPIAETAAALAVAGIVAEVVHESHGANSKAAPEAHEPEAGEDADDKEHAEAKHHAETPTPDPDEAEDEADVEAGEADKGEEHDHGGPHEDKAEDANDDAEEDEDRADVHGHKADEDNADEVKADEVKADEDKSPEDEAEEDKADDEAADKGDEEHKAEADDAAAGGTEAEHGEEQHGADQHSEDTHGEDTDAAKGEDAIIPKGKASGYTPMQAKAGATQYQPAMSVKFGKLPNKVDLRPLMTPIEDQGDTSSCVANAVAGAYEYWIKKASKQDHNISRLFVYYNARWRDGSQDKDGGSVIQLAMDGLSKFGACNEKVWPFDPHLILKKPGADAYQDAAPYKVHDMAQVPLKLEAWKQALAEGKPIVFGCELFDSFDECSKRGGVVPMPAPDDIARKKHSGHSMCAVGYSDSEKVFIVRNSWGADWGDKGYCYMPYAYLMSDKFNDGDCWVFIPKVPSQPPREVWSDDTKPVTNGGEGVTFPIETYTVADYAKISVDLFETIRKPFNGVLVEDFSNYVSLAGRGLWTEMESFDYRTFLASTAALAGIAAITAEFSSSSESSESSSSSSESIESSEDKESDEEQDADEESDEDQDEDDASDEDEESDEDADEDKDTDEDADEDKDADEDADEDKDADEDADEDKDADEDADEDKDADEDADEDKSDDEESDDAAEDEEPEDEDTEEDDAEDDAGGDDGGGDEGGGEGDDE